MTQVLSITSTSCGWLTAYRRAGIAHTRWATHGEPSANNSHPVSSGVGHEFSVVHNGIITNHRELRQYLEKAGEVFTTETDTEVIPRLCHYVYKNLEGPVEFSKLVMEVLKKLQGAYALLVQSVYYPGEVVSCCKGSPLLFGLKASSGALPLRVWLYGERCDVHSGSGIHSCDYRFCKHRLRGVCRHWQCSHRMEGPLPAPSSQDPWQAHTITCALGIPIAAVITLPYTCGHATHACDFIHLFSDADSLVCCRWGRATLQANGGPGALVLGVRVARMLLCKR